MPLLKPLMIMGGSLQEAARSPTRASLRESIQKLAGNTFSAMMEAQSRGESPQADMQAVQTRTLAGLARVMDRTGDPLQDAMLAQSVHTMVGALNQDIASRPSRYAKTAGTSMGALNKNRDVLPTGSAAADAVRAARRRQSADSERLGSLSARFESGRDIAAIGYDRVGGTSYGKYQIASKPGSMDNFIQFLDKEAPDLAGELRAAGPANTGSRKGRMPEAWKAIAAREPERFTNLQEDFIRESHYEPALEAVRAAGFNTDDFSPALKEVLWSTSVQHGPASAAKIFIRAAEKADPAKIREKDLIKGVYAGRAGQFGSSTEAVRAAVHNRLRQEQHMALAMTDKAKAG